MLRDTNTLIEYHYKRNPKFKLMLDELDEFNLDDIEYCGLPKWMREHLAKLKNTQITQQNRAATIQQATPVVMANTSFGYAPDRPGKIVKYLGNERFIRFGKSELLMKHGDVIFVEQAGIWFDTVFTNVIDPNLQPCALVGDATFLDYKSYVRTESNKLIPTSNSLEYQEEKPLFRVIRDGKEYTPRYL